jgi:hypothetical protein
MTGIRLVVAVSSAAVGTMLGSFGVAGCGTDDCNCGPPEAIVEGTFDVTAVRSPSTNQTLFEASGATVTVGANAVAIDYSRGEARVTAHYRVVSKYPR